MSFPKFPQHLSLRIYRQSNYALQTPVLCDRIPIKAVRFTDITLIYFIIFVVGYCVFMIAFGLIFGLTQRNKIKNDTEETTYETQDIHVTVIDLCCAVRTIGYKTPETITIFTVIFQTDGDKILTFTVPQEMYDCFEKGQTGLLTIVDGNPYSFTLDEPSD